MKKTRSVRDTSGTMEADSSVRCRECGNASGTLLRCSKCKLAKYCSRECQKKDWPLHKTQCDPESVLGTVFEGFLKNKLVQDTLDMIQPLSDIKNGHIGVPIISVIPSSFHSSFDDVHYCIYMAYLPCKAYESFVKTVKAYPGTSKSEVSLILLRVFVPKTKDKDRGAFIFEKNIAEVRYEVKGLATFKRTVADPSHQQAIINGTASIRIIKTDLSIRLDKDDEREKTRCMWDPLYVQKNENRVR